MSVSPSPARTVSQKYAERAFGQVKTILDAKRQSTAKEYLSASRAFPILLRQCGLAQAVAYANSRSREDIHHALLSHLAAVMERPGGDLSKASREAPLHDYIRLTRDALQAASWLKRTAEGLLRDLAEPPPDGPEPTPPDGDPS